MGERLITLDRMEIEDTGTNKPDRLARAIHLQLEQQGQTAGAVPVQAVAAALDIVEVRTEPLTNLAGALITTAERNNGSILVNANANDQRQRFTIAHELGHFLNLWHRATTADGFACTGSDLRQTGSASRPGLSRHDVQEREANRFAAELLMPVSRMRLCLAKPPAIEVVLDLAKALDCSRETMARRYVEHHDAAVAIVFSRDGQCRYAISSGSFPAMGLRSKDPMPMLPAPKPGAVISEPIEVDPDDWAVAPNDNDAMLTAQTLHQQNGFAMTLLHYESDDEDDIEDAFERYTRFGQR